MPIYQINIWVCEICGKTISTSKKVEPYDDPVVIYPDRKEWGYVGEDKKMACPECFLLCK